MLAVANRCRAGSGHGYDHRVAGDYLGAAIRTALPADVAPIAVLHLESWRAAYAGFVSEDFLRSVTLESRLERWGRALNPSLSPLTETVVAHDGATILGVCSFGFQRQPPSLRVGEIYSLHVRPDVKRRGLGKLLLDESLHRVASRGCERCVLWVLRDNADARRFYESQGWSPTGEEMVEDRSGWQIPETRYAIPIDTPA
jgi:ribosomal protein S18 acetylase RimI-like enzyme